jgi:hypothetical protein
MQLAPLFMSSSSTPSCACAHTAHDEFAEAVCLHLVLLLGRLAKPPLGTPRKIGQGCKWHSFTTNTYKLHFLESPSGIKVRLSSSSSMHDGAAAVCAWFQQLICCTSWSRPQTSSCAHQHQLQQ